MEKMQKFLEAQAKAEQLKDEIVQELRAYIKEIWSKTGVPMEELLGQEILAQLSADTKHARHEIKIKKSPKGLRSYGEVLKMKTEGKGNTIKGHGYKAINHKPQ